MGKWVVKIDASNKIQFFFSQMIETLFGANITIKHIFHRHGTLSNANVAM